MPPTRAREQLARQAQSANAYAPTPELIAKRAKRHLDELEHSNYTERNLASYSEGDHDAEDGKYTKGRARQTISDKRNLNIPGAKKKKSTMNIRSALLYRKTFSTLVEESGIMTLPLETPTYLTAQTSPPNYPPRLMCTVCGYWGRYKCGKCAMAYCDGHCKGVHDETRCERRVI